MMKKYFRTLHTVLLLFVFSIAHGQTLPPLQPEQDACNALPLCGGVFSTPYSYQGPGAKLEQSQFAGACFDETNSVWLRLEIATSGTINFTITPVLTSNDYDFAVYNITGKTCDSINASTRVRCNGCDIGSSPGGLTGLSSTASGTVSGPGLGPNYISSIAATAGQTYLVMIDNFYQGTQSGFSIDFSASTATFVGGSPPSYDTITRACSYADSLHVHLSKQVKCTSLQSNGSDFRLSPALGTVASAVGANCNSSGNGYTQDLTLYFTSPLPPGVYALRPNIGTDGNTLLDLCNVPQPLSDSLAFTVAGPLTVNPGPDTVICINNPIQLDANPGGGPWTSLAYTWTPSTYLSSTTVRNPISTPSAPITYSVTVVPNGMPGCARTGSVRVNILNGFELANHDTTICFGASVQLSAVGDPRYSYAWTPPAYLTDPSIPNPVSSPAATTTYTVTASHVGCRDTSKTVTIIVQPGPAVYIGPDVTLCYGDTIHMNPSIVPDTFAGYLYNWTPASYFSFANIKDPIFTATDTVTITLDVTTTAGCQSTDSRVINVIPSDFAVVIADTGICPNNSVQLNVTGGDTYQWSPPLYLDNDTIPNPISTPLSTTSYSVYAQDLLGCRDTQYVTITVYPEALISLPDSVNLFPGDTYQINPGGNGLYFTWSPPGGLSAANIANPVAQPTVNTRYFVTATTENGCSISDSMDINVLAESAIDVPNAFTPGSAPNALLAPVHRGNVALKYFRVFNRWGAKVFETSDINEGWDGAINGKPQPIGVYIYMVQAVLPSGKVFTKQGNVTLLR